MHWSRRHVLAAMAGAAPLAAGARAQTPTPVRAPIALAMREGTAALLPAPGAPLTIWGYDGRLDAPPIRVRQGESVLIEVTNALPEPSSFHVHGLRIPQPARRIAPGATERFELAPPDAGTFFYRPAMADTHQWARGLSGAFIVDTAPPAEAEHDVVVVLRDLAVFADARVADGRAAPPASDPRLGVVLTVNGEVRPAEWRMKPFDRVRVRLCNASALRPLPIHAPGATRVAQDGQPAEPVALADTPFLLGPGNRADLMWQAQGPGDALTIGAMPGRRMIDIARLSVPADEAPAPARPATPVTALPDNPVPRRLDLARATRVRLALDGEDRPAPAFQARRGATVVLTLDNVSDVPRSVYVHGHALRPLDRLDDGWKPWFLDTVLLGPGESGLFGFVAGPPGRWGIETVALDGSFRVTSTAFDIR